MQQITSIANADWIDKQLFETDTFYPGKELMAALNAIFKHPLTVVGAPFGYGQAAAVRCFLERTNAQVLWHRMVRQAPDAVWEGICDILRRVSPALSDVLKLYDLRDDQNCREAVAAVEAQVRASAPSVLVLEEFQCAPGEVIKFLTLLAKRGVRNLFLVLITTRAFPLDDELLLNGCVNRITMETLALSRQEIVRKFSLAQMKLTEEEADFIDRYSEGWLAAVQFLMMSRCANPSLSLDRPDDYDGPFLRAFEQTALEKLPRPCKTLLCYLADRADFTQDEADFFLAFDAEAGETAHNVLQYMIDRSMFVSYAPGEKRYHLHPVLRRMVQKRILPLSSAGRRAEICERNALWFEQNNQFDRALSYYERAGNDAACLRALCRLTRFQDLSVTAGLVRRLFGAYHLASERPGSVPDPPAFQALTALARYAALLGDDALYEEILHEIDQARPSVIPEEFAPLYERLRRVAPTKLHGWMLALDDERGLAALADCFDVSFGSISLVCALPAPLGNLNRRCELWKDFAGPDNERGSLFAGASPLLFAELQLLRGSFAEAEIYLHAAIRNAREAGNPGVWVTACCTLARLMTIQGDGEGAGQLLSDIRQALERESPSRLDATLDLCEYAVAMLDGHPERRAGWLTDDTEAARRLYAPALRELKLLRRLSLLFERRYAEYISYCVEEPTIPGCEGLVPELILKLGLAYASDRAGLLDGALKALGEALDAAGPEELYAPFMFLRHWMRTLSGAQEDERRASALRKIDALCERSHFRRPALEGANPAEAGHALTRREAEIVECLRAGASNREIASRLYISENTVKSILKKIYAKLEISSRHELARASEPEGRP